MFKYSTRAEVTRKYYERRIRHFFDLIGFDLESKTDLQKRCNNFAYKGRSEIDTYPTFMINDIHDFIESKPPEDNKLVHEWKQSTVENMTFD
jgi:NADH:ubiquinone oxidoreductase subunit